MGTSCFEDATTTMTILSTNENAMRTFTRRISASALYSMSFWLEFHPSRSDDRILGEWLPWQYMVPPREGTAYDFPLSWGLYEGPAPQSWMPWDACCARDSAVEFADTVPTGLQSWVILPRAHQCRLHDLLLHRLYCRMWAEVHQTRGQKVVLFLNHTPWRKAYFH